MLKKLYLSVVFVLVGQLFFAGAVVAADYFDPDSVAWKFRYNRNDNSFANDWKQYKKDGYIIIDLETDKIRGIKYSGVWQKNTDGRKWASYRQLTSAQFGDKWSDLKSKGYRPIDIDMTMINGKMRYSLIMVQNKERLKWSSNRNLTAAQFTEKFNARKGTYKPVDIDAVNVNGNMRYSVIWLQNKPKTGWYLHRDMTPAVYGQKFAQYRRSGYRVTDLDCYKKNGKLTYTAIWEKNKAGRGWSASREMSATGFRNNWKKNIDRGMRLVDVEACPAKSGNGTQYAAVWRENDKRYDWRGRSQAQRLIADFVDDNRAPGVAVAVISGGKTIFRSGSGFADREKGIAAHSGTIYRTASIAKAITGALAFDMQDAQMIGLGQRTDTMVFNLGNLHRHNTLQLLQNTGCVGNYSDVPGNENNDQTQYVSSRVTLSSKQSGVLQSNNAIFTPCSPGNTYRYSTHGYTLAAAALESRSGMNFDALLRARISNPLGLRTLRTETRSNGASKGDLAQLYARPSGGGYTPLLDNNFQNISWKWGGGGMEVSALDLAKFGNAMLDNKLFPQSLRDQMWSGSSARNSYGAGWDTNSTTNPTLVQKQGRQQSSLSHIRIDVDDDIVVVAMTNGSYRSSEGSIITQLTADLMTIARTNQ